MFPLYHSIFFLTIICWYIDCYLNMIHLDIFNILPLERFVNVAALHLTPNPETKPAKEGRIIILTIKKKKKNYRWQKMLKNEKEKKIPQCKSQDFVIPNGGETCQGLNRLFRATRTLAIWSAETGQEESSKAHHSCPLDCSSWLERSQKEGKMTEVALRIPFTEWKFSPTC